MKPEEAKLLRRELKASIDYQGKLERGEIYPNNRRSLILIEQRLQADIRSSLVAAGYSVEE